MSGQEQQRAGEPPKAVLAALAANVGIAIAKFIAFLVTGSGSMLAESIHSVADSTNQVLLLVGRGRASRAPDEEHAFGHGRAAFFWAFLVAILLFAVGGLFSLFEGYEKLVKPHEVESPLVAIVVLVVAMVLEGLSLRTAIGEAAEAREGRSFWQFIKVTTQPELAVVLLEDSAAVTGLLLALTGVALSALTGNATFDALGTLAIGALLIIVAGVLARETHSLLLGESASPGQVHRIREVLAQAPRVERVIHLRTEYLGTEELLVAAKVAFDGGLTFAEVADAINGAEARLRDAVPDATLVYLEPDVLREA